MSTIESNTTRGRISLSEEINRPVAFQFDPEKYRAELDGFDITEEQKQELMATLWNIMCRFVELGFSVDVCTALLGGVPTIPSDGELE